MDIESIWASRPWEELTSEERIATVRLILQEVARGQNPDLINCDKLMADMAPDVTRLLDRVISPGPGPAPAAVAALEGDLKAEAGSY